MYAFTNEKNAYLEVAVTKKLVFKKHFEIFGSLLVAWGTTCNKGISVISSETKFIVFAVGGTIKLETEAVCLPSSFEFRNADERQGLRNKAWRAILSA